MSEGIAQSGSRPNLRDCAGKSTNPQYFVSCANGLAPIPMLWCSTSDARLEFSPPRLCSPTRTSSLWHLILILPVSRSRGASAAMPWEAAAAGAWISCFKVDAGGELGDSHRSNCTVDGKQHFKRRVALDQI